MLTFGQKKVNKACLIAYIDTTSGSELTGYKSLNGEIIIKAKYQNGDDILCEMAIVLDSKFGFVGINRNDSIILKPYIYDNGPDYLEEGVFRFVENGKIGFANLKGQKILEAKYDFATPFSFGISEYSIGGEEIYEDGKSKKQIIQESGYEGLVDKHWVWGGDIKESGWLNKYGQEFERVTELNDNKREAWTKDNKHFLLNRKGQIIKTYNK